MLVDKMKLWNYNFEIIYKTLEYFLSEKINQYKSLQVELVIYMRTKKQTRFARYNIVRPKNKQTSVNSSVDVSLS